MSTGYVRLPLLNSYIEHWAQETPDKPAMLQHEDGREISYKQFLSLTDFFTLRLFGWYGPQGGDNPATISRVDQQALIIDGTVELLGALMS